MTRPLCWKGAPLIPIANWNNKTSHLQILRPGWRKITALPCKRRCRSNEGWRSMRSFAPYRSVYLWRLNGQQTNTRTCSRDDSLERNFLLLFDLLIVLACRLSEEGGQGGENGSKDSILISSFWRVFSSPRLIDVASVYLMFAHDAPTTMGFSSLSALYFPSTSPKRCGRWGSGIRWGSCVCVEGGGGRGG